MKRLLLLLLLLAAPGARAAIALDSTAHPGGVTNNLVATSTLAASLTTPSFSTGPGPVLLVLVYFGDFSPAPFPVTVTGAGLTWTQRVSKIMTTNFPNTSGLQIYTAFSATGNLSAVTATVTPSASSSGTMQLTVLNGVASTEAGCIGNTGGFIDDSPGGVNTTANATVTPAATGSWLIGAFASFNNSTTLTADSNTSAYDYSVSNAGSDTVNFGRYKTGGTVALTTAGVAVTFGSTVSNLYVSTAALEVKVGSGGGGGSTTPAYSNGRRRRAPGPLASAAPSFPLSAHSSGRYMVDAAGKPFFIMADSSWSAESNLTSAERTTFINDRASRGFNGLLIEAMEYKFAINAPADRAGNFPFTSHTIGSYDFTTPNTTYWANVDDVISKAAAAGMVVFLDAIYLGSSGGPEGWWAEVTNATNTAANCLTYGTWIGNRYKNSPNVVWVIGGDFTPPSDVAAESGETRTIAIYTGIRASGATQPVVAHVTGNALSSSWTRFSANQTMLGVYYYADVPGNTRTAYQATPTKPVFLQESHYEDESAVSSDVRLQAWGGILSGGVAGTFYGQRDVWSFQTGTWCNGFAYGCVNWTTMLGRPGTTHMTVLRNVLNGISWWLLQPNGLQVSPKTLITAGGGTAGGTDYVSAANTPDGTLLMAYVPPAHTGSVTIDLTAMSGSFRSRWLDPTTGTYTVIGTGVANVGTQAFTTPGANSNSDTDWLLVLSIP